MTCDLCKHGKEIDFGSIHCFKYDVTMAEFCWEKCEKFEYSDELKEDEE